MDDFSKQITLGLAYDVATYTSKATNDQLFWALDRFTYDHHDLDESAREQRLEARQKCALELDRRNVPMRNPMVEIEFPRIFPDVTGFRKEAGIC